jgi:outer membrane protein assembly factor BamE (lipoprotein component of BamABCDE complex)
MSAETRFWLVDQHSRPRQRDPGRKWVSVTYQDNEFDQTLATHQDADAEAFSPQQFATPSSQCTANDLAREGHGNNSNDIGPSNAIIEETEVSA